VLELLSTLETQRSKIKCLEGQLSEQNVSELEAEIAEQSAQLRARTEVLSAQNADLKARNDTIRTLENENNMLKLNTGYLSKSLESVNLQNEKLSVANRELTDRLQEEYRRAIESIHEKTGIAVDRIVASKKLEEANSRIAALEYQLEEKNAKDSELQVLQKSCG
jgi:chromosome segregation ATPase